LLKKGDLIKLEIQTIAFGGEGIGRHEGLAIFVPMSVPGDIVEAEIISLKKSYGRALIKKVIKAGEDRVNDNRITFEEFCGCDFAMLNYDAQLKHKEIMLKEIIERVGKAKGFDYLPIVGADNPYNYRNKVIEPFAKKNGKIISGFFRRKSHDVFEVEENILQTSLANKIISEFKKLANREKISVYDERSGKGKLRHIMVRTNSFNEAMVVVIIKGKLTSKLNFILKKLFENTEEIKSMYVSINNRRTNVALGSENILVEGTTTVREELFGMKFNISPTSFFQINIEQTKKLYKNAIEMFTDINEQSVVDAYSGTGTIGMILSKEAKKVYSIELVESATKDAIKTADENSIDNIEFINGKVEEKLIELINNNIKLDSIIFDPPRKGMAKNIIDKLSEIDIKEIVYISCNPSTFSRDSELLEAIGYKLERVQGVDMFPQTSHIEVIGKFVKKEKS